MGLFSSNFQKAGPGVSKNAPPKKRIVLFGELFVRKFWKIIQMNLLYVLFCLPIVTIGPATAALTYVMRCFVQEKPVFLFADFLDAFKKNWKQSAITWVLSTAIIALMGLAIFTYSGMADQTFAWNIPLVLVMAFALVVIMTHFYIYLLIVTVDLKLTQIIKNSFILALAGLKSNLLTVVWLVLIWGAMVLFFPYTVILLPFFPLAFSVFIVCFNSYPHVRKYVIDPYYDRTGERNPEKPEGGQDAENVLFEDMGGKELPIRLPNAGKGKRIR